jgi:excisionase family DNA binding protein
MTYTDKVETTESPPLPRLSYKINEAAKILGVSPITIRRAISRGLLKPCRAFRHPLIPAEQLKKLITPRED